MQVKLNAVGINQSARGRKPAQVRPGSETLIKKAGQKQSEQAREKGQESFGRTMITGISD